MWLFRRFGIFRKYVILILIASFTVLVLHYFLHQNGLSTADRFAPGWRDGVQKSLINDDDESIESLRNKLEELEKEDEVKDLRNFTKLISQPPGQKQRWLRYEFENMQVIRFTNQMVSNFTSAKLNELSSGSLCTAEAFYMSAISKLTAYCSPKQRLGREKDGGWYVCLSGPFHLQSDSCVSFSFGVGGIWEYDDAVASKMGCKAFAFDPSEQFNNYTRSSGVRFYRIGVASRTRFMKQLKWSMDTLSNIARSLIGTDEVIDLLKLDIEGSEWSVLQQAAKSGLLSRVKQLLIEFHTEELNQISSSVAGYVQKIQVLKLLHRIGFRLWQSEANKIGKFYTQKCPYHKRACCHNNYYININFLPKDKEKEAELLESVHQTKNHVQLRPLKLLDSDKQSAESLYFKLMSADHADCHSWQRIGPQHDSGYNLCFADGFQLKPGCIVYSFGVADQFGFEDKLASNYRCSVRMFDPSTQHGNHKRGPKEWFYALGLGGVDATRSNGWRMRTFESLLLRFRHSDAIIDVLKIDIELDEWDALETCVRDSSLLKVKQLVIETHTKELVDQQTSSADYLRYVRIWLQLYKIGFRQWYSWQNPRTHFRGQSGQDRPCCHVHSLINIHFLPDLPSE